MEKSEAAAELFSRIKKFEPEYIARKITGYVLLEERPDQEIIRLALGPDGPIKRLIQEYQEAIFMASGPGMYPTVNPAPFPDPSLQFNSFSPRHFPPGCPFPRVAVHPLFEPPVFADEELVSNYPVSAMEDSSEMVKLLRDGYYNSAAEFQGLGVRGRRNNPVKICHHFIKGHCKHGDNCRYFHVRSPDHSYPYMCNIRHSYDGSGDDQMLSPGSLDKLELEITELLKSRRGSPVSIASLPTLYYDKYRRNLQAEGYLTESQRHGKAGYSLTKLLARLKNSIKVIDRPNGQHDVLLAEDAHRPHGQHAVVLAEDAHKYMDIRGERNDPGPVVHGSRQIYLTFPCESTFTEDDVSEYFSSFGPVQDVRIPCQQKRMFGFVTFVSSDTVKLILSKANPHYVCGARVLVKQYREKSKLIERKNHDKFENPVFYHSQMDSEFHAARLESIHLERIIRERQQHAREVERIRFSQLQLAQSPFPGFGYYVNEPKLIEEQSKLTSAEQLNSYLEDALNHGSTSEDDNRKYSANSCGDQESAQGLNLPESPFVPAPGSVSVSAVI